METDKPIVNKDGYSSLPEDYNNWSSTVILFREIDKGVNVFALNCDDCAVYFVVSCPRREDLYRILGYAVGDLKVFFAGDITFDSNHNAVNSKVVSSYDIPKRECVVSIPPLNYPKPTPFVFFADEHLYVLSSSMSCPMSGKFEALHIKDGEILRRWEALPPPAFVLGEHWACDHNIITDYSKKTVYIRLLDFSDSDCNADLYGYHYDNNILNGKWLKYDNLCCFSDQEDRLSKLGHFTARQGNLLKAPWSNDCVIVEDNLYRFQMLKYREGLRATLIIRDLEHEIKVLTNAVECDFVDEIHDDNDPCVGGISEVNISGIVAPDVLRDLYAVGSLVYLGKRNSCLRFSLVISYTCKSCTSGGNHVSACTFDLTLSSTNVNQPTAVRVSCSPCQHINVGSGSLACHKLCEVRDD